MIINKINHEIKNIFNQLMLVLNNGRTIESNLNDETKLTFNLNTYFCVGLTINIEDGHFHT